MKNQSTKWVAQQAWVEGQWAREVVLTVAANGDWASVLPHASAAQQAGATRLAGAVLPGVVNAHSHALQRIRAGLIERRGPLASESSAMPAARRLSPGQRVSPAQLEAVASQLYAEMLTGGYTHVCEFLDLHSAAPAEQLEMAQALVRAARRVGLGLTLLPALARRAEPGGAAASDDLRKLADGPGQVMRLVETINRQAATAVRPRPGAGGPTSPGPGLVSAGVGLHGFDVAEAAAMQALAAAAHRTGLPVHIQIAEHQAEVAACLAATGQTPIDWLLGQVGVDARWNLVHATQATANELHAVRKAGAAIVACPSSAASLGQGMFDLQAFSALGGKWSIGSGRNLARSWPEELRLLEYARRQAQAGQPADPANLANPANQTVQATGRESRAAKLFDAAVAGGQAATGQRVGAIQVGCRADFLVLDPASPPLLGLAAAHQLEALVFSSPAARFREVFVAGVCTVRDGRVVGPGHDSALAADIADGFVAAMHALYAPGAPLPPAGIDQRPA